MKGFSIRHALTKGISAVDVHVAGQGWLHTKGGPCLALREGVDFFRTVADAKVATRLTAKKEIARLEKRLKALREIAVDPKVSP